MIYFIDCLKLSHSAFLSQINVFKVEALDNYSIQGNQYHMPQIDGVPKNEYKEGTKLFRLEVAGCEASGAPFLWFLLLQCQRG